MPGVGQIKQDEAEQVQRIVKMTAVAKPAKSMLLYAASANQEAIDKAVEIML